MLIRYLFRIAKILKVIGMIMDKLIIQLFRWPRIVFNGSDSVRYSVNGKVMNICTSRALGYFEIEPGKIINNIDRIIIKKSIRSWEGRDEFVTDKTKRRILKRVCKFFERRGERWAIVD